MMFTILSAILHLTNIRFSHDDETDGVFIEDEYPLEVGKYQTNAIFQFLIRNLKCI
jgi:hypothetical protein